MPPALAEPQVATDVVPLGAPVSDVLRCVDRGWPVFPLRPGSKVPATRHGFKDARRDRRLIEDWWARRPTSNYGIATGAVSGLVVLDVDGDRGREALAVLEWKHGPLPSTFQVSTPRGGCHLGFEHPGIEVRSFANETVGLDFRGDGGYVVGPGSVVGGKPYVIEEDVPPAPLPDWLLERVLAHCLDPAQLPPRARSVRSVRSVRSLRSDRYEPGGQERVDAGAREAGSEDRLADTQAVAAVLETIGRPGISFGESYTAKFSCPLYDHADVEPSADLYRCETGRWRFACRSCGTKLALVELFASVTTGTRVSFEGKSPTAARWLLRMWHEAGIDPVEVPALEVPGVKLTKSDRSWADGFLLLRALRRHVGDYDFIPYTRDFAEVWCGLSESSVKRATRKLTGCGWLRIKASPPEMRVGHLFDLGPVLDQTPSVFESTVPWVVFDEDGLAVEDRQERHAVAGQEDLPVGPSGVEVQAGCAAVDEGDDLLDVAQVALAERVTRLGELDASGGPAQSLGLGHGAAPYARPPTALAADAPDPLHVRLTRGP